MTGEDAPDTYAEIQLSRKSEYGVYQGWLKDGNLYFKIHLKHV